MCVNVCPLVCLSVAYGLSSLCTLLQSPRNRPPGLTASLDALKPEMPKIDEVSEPEKSTTSTITISTSPTTPTPLPPRSSGSGCERPDVGGGRLHQGCDQGHGPRQQSQESPSSSGPGRPHGPGSHRGIQPLRHP